MDDGERVAVRVAFVVRVVEPLAHLGGDVRGELDGHSLLVRLPVLEELLEVRAVDELHHDEVRVGGATEVEDGDDVRVVQEERELRFVRNMFTNLSFFARCGARA